MTKESKKYYQIAPGFFIDESTFKKMKKRKGEKKPEPNPEEKKK